MKDLVSVIISTYKREYELERAIRSVLNQTYKNIEIIVVDDNGVGTEKQIKVEQNIMKRYLKYKNIKYIVNKKNIGGSLTRNKGIDEAKGNYISFLDDDDEYYPEKIQKQLELFKKSQKSNLALVYCYTDSYDENNKKLEEYKYNYTGNCLVDAMCMCIAATSQWMCKKSLIESVGNFTDVPSKQDSTVIIKLLDKGYEIDRVPDVLVRYNEHSNDRISTGGPKNIKGEEILRDYCRSLYNKLSSYEIIRVEESFSYRLSKLYIKNLSDKIYLELKTLKKINKIMWLKIKLYFNIKKYNYIKNKKLEVNNDYTKS